MPHVDDGVRQRHAAAALDRRDDDTRWLSGTPLRRHRSSCRPDVRALEPGVDVVRALGQLGHDDARRDARHRRRRAAAAAEDDAAALEALASGRMRRGPARMPRPRATRRPAQQRDYLGAGSGSADRGVVVVEGASLVAGRRRRRVEARSRGSPDAVVRPP